MKIEIESQQRGVAPPRQQQPPTQRHRGGRPTVRTPKLVASILEMVAEGMPLMMAAKAGEISYQTFSNWRSRDPDLETQLQAAIAKGVRENLRVVRRCMKSKDEGVALRASCWYLEHVHPEHFARNRIEVTGADGGPLAGLVAIWLPPKADSNGGQLPVVAVPALTEGSRDGNGNG